MSRAKRGTVALFALLLTGALAALACGNDEPEPADETDVAVEEAPALEVASVALGRAIGPEKRVVAEVGTFAPGDTIYASVETAGTGSGTLAARWTYEDGQVVDETSHAVGGGGQVSEFHISKPDGWPTGHYEVAILLNGTEVERKGFDVAAGS